MRRSLHRRSRALLAFALLAWIAFSFDPSAHSLAMAGEMSVKVPMGTGASSATHCDGMSMPQTSRTSRTSHPAPLHPAPNGHGCCTGQGCYCASLLSGIAGAPYLSLTWQPAYSSVLVPVSVAPPLIHAAPPLRPPIT